MRNRLRPSNDVRRVRGLDEDFLGRVLRILRVTKHPNRDVVDPRLVPPDKRFERRPPAGTCAGHELLILAVLVDIVGKGVVDVHRLLPIRHGRRFSATEV